MPAPIGVDPVNPTFLISGWSQILCPTTEPDPGIILIVPFGKPALAASSANFKAVIGVT